MIINMIKRRVTFMGVMAALLILVLCALYQVVVPQSPMTVTFLGYTNFVSGRFPRAIFAVTNTSTHLVRRWGWEEHSPSGLRGRLVHDRAVTLKPGQGEHLEISPGALPTWRLAVLSTGPLNEPPPKKWTVNVLKRKNISYEQNEWKTEQTEIQSRIQR